MQYLHGTSQTPPAEHSHAFRLARANEVMENPQESKLLQVLEVFEREKHECLIYLLSDIWLLKNTDLTSKNLSGEKHVGDASMQCPFISTSERGIQ